MTDGLWDVVPLPAQCEGKCTADAQAIKIMMLGSCYY